mgnify:CR=1 FL=1
MIGRRVTPARDAAEAAELARLEERCVNSPGAACIRRRAQLRNEPDGMSFEIPGVLWRRDPRRRKCP